VAGYSLGCSSSSKLEFAVTACFACLAAIGETIVWNDVQARMFERLLQLFNHHGDTEFWVLPLLRAAALIPPPRHVISKRLSDNSIAKPPKLNV
jgi:hypothetical protein